MVESKKWYMSKGLWGSVVTIVSSCAAFFGVMISPDMQAELTVLILSLITAVSGFVGFVGRLLATKQIN